MLSYPVIKALEETSKKNSSFVSFEEDLSRRSTIGIGGPAAAWYEPSSVSELSGAFVFLRSMNVKTFFLGSGSNTLLPSRPFDAVVINLSAREFVRMNFAGDLFRVGAGVKLGSAISEAAKKGFSGLEGLVGIPGTVGGALVMNASYKTAISDCLEEVTCIDAGGRPKKMKKEEMNFAYRKSAFNRREAIIEAVFRLKKSDPDAVKEKIRSYFSEKMDRQPLHEKTLGCVFKNPDNGPGSGGLIDKAGLKGIKIGGASVSVKHANFIVNSGKATSKDFHDLMKNVQSVVSEKFGVILEPEIEIID